MSTLQVIVSFLELEHAVQAVAASDDVSKRLRKQLEDLCRSHHQQLLCTLSRKRSTSETQTKHPLKGGCGERSCTQHVTKQ
jgi:hypothetical protein